MTTTPQADGANASSHELQRKLSNRHLQLIAIGGAIGTGLFMGSGKTISLAGPSILIIYMIIGTMFFFLMRALGEILGIVACGYADGYQRITATGTPILVDGQRSSLVGRVSMDMLAVDLSHLPNAQVGSEVVLWGTSKQGAVLSIDEVAAGSGTIGYELMCAVTARVNFIQD